jgi:hypothetical protein
MLSTIDLDNSSAPKRRSRGTLGRTFTAMAVVVAAVVLTAYAKAAEPRPAYRTPTNTAANPAPVTPESVPRLVVPASATAGSTITILGYRNPDLCGPTQVGLDGVLLTVTIIGGAESTNRIRISIQIPKRTLPGPHRVDLYGPMRAAGGMLCGRTPEHQTRIATATITVPARPGPARWSRNGPELGGAGSRLVSFGYSGHGVGLSAFVEQTREL